MTERTFHCGRLVGTIRCQFSGNNEAAGEHWRETGHARCLCCGNFLTDDESVAMACTRCVTNVRADLAEIVESVALAPEVIEAGGYRGILIDLLAYVSDGAVESPRQQIHPDDYVYLNSRGEKVSAEEPNDPWPVLAVLEAIERTWRLEFGHGPATVVATITSCASYLEQWLWLASRSFRGFDDDAATLRTLASRLRHAVGLADDPVKGVGCFDCDGTLQRTYRVPVWPVPDPRRSVDGQRGLEFEGLADTWTCPKCRRDYEPESYYLAVRAALEAEKEAS